MSFSVSLCIDIFRIIVYCYLTTNKQPPTKPNKHRTVDNNLKDVERRKGGTDRKEKQDMKKNFYYKNIVLYQTFGKWSALYSSIDGTFTLHACCTDTKVKAYQLAKDMVDYLNEKTKGV